jgi:hypothetical protein
MKLQPVPWAELGVYLPGGVVPCRRATSCLGYATTSLGRRSLPVDAGAWNPPSSSGGASSAGACEGSQACTQGPSPSSLGPGGSHAICV